MFYENLEHFGIKFANFLLSFQFLNLNLKVMRDKGNEWKIES